MGQFTANKVQLLQRSTGLIVVPSPGSSNLTTSSWLAFDRYPSPTRFAKVGVSREFFGEA